MENENDLLEVENPEQEQDLNLEVDTYEDDSAEKIKKAEEIARNQRIRAEKAERELKALKAAPKEEKSSTGENLSLKDIRALQDVADEDVEEVTDFAKFKGITVAEAKKHPVMVSLLRTKAEERASQEAMSTSKKGVKKVSDEVLLDRVKSGDNMSDEEMRLAAQAQLRQWKGN